MARSRRLPPARAATSSKKARRGIGPALLAGGASLALCCSAEALVINATYDGSVNSAPAGFRAAFQSAIDFFQSTFSDPITINIGVGWGEVGGYSIAPGALGESGTYLAGYYTYNQVRNGLIADAKSSADSTAINSLSATDPTGGRSFLMPTAEARALGLRSGGGTDGFVGFDRTASWTFDPAHRAVSGQFDFIGVAEHEISEVMGRSANLGTFYGALEPLDLFRYSSPNTRALRPGNNQYFSIDGGVTNINTFNGTGGGDIGDWAGYTTDAFNATDSSGNLLAASPGDITALDVIGYDLATQSAPPPSPASPPTFRFSGFGNFGAQEIAVPEPSSLALLGAALFGLGFFRRNRARGSYRR